MDLSQFDMSQLDKLTYLSFNNCTAAVEIRNLKYTGNLAGLFTNCRTLQKISGVIANVGNSINQIFNANMLIFCEHFVLSRQNAPFSTF